MIFKRAFHDTFSGQLTALFILAFGGLISIGYLYFRLGRAEAVEEVPYVQGAILGAIGALTLLFLWNLACAPFRIERDGRIALESENLELKKMVQRPKKRHLNDEQKASLSDAIRDAGVRPETMNVLYMPTSEESGDFAADIGDAIKRAGIDCTVHNGVKFDHNPKDRGIKIIHGKSKTIIKLAGAVQARFKELGFHPEKRPDMKYDDKIFLYVARSPEMD